MEKSTDTDVRFPNPRLRLPTGWQLGIEAVACNQMQLERQKAKQSTVEEMTLKFNLQ